MKTQARQSPELQESEQPLRLLVEAVKDFAVFMLDAEGRVTIWNEGAQRMKQYAAGEILGQHFECFYTPEDVARGKPGRELEIAAREGRHAEEGWRVRKDGSRFWASVTITAIQDAEGKVRGYGKVTQDLTQQRQAQERLQSAALFPEENPFERKRAEEATRRSQETLSELVERSPFGTYVVDAGFRIAMMNASSQEGAFRNVRPIIGRDFAEAMRVLWPESVAGEIIGRFRHTLDTGEPYYSRGFINSRHDEGIVEAYEWELHRMTLPDGQYGVICYYYDSTKLREAERSGRESEVRLRLALTAANLGTWDFNLVTGGLMWDRRCKELFGLPPEAEVSYEMFLAGLHPEDREPVNQIVRRTFSAASGGLFDIEYRTVGLRDGGVMRWVRATGLASFDEGGKATRFIGTVQDITARKQAEGAVRAREADLSEAQRQAHIGSWHWDAQTDVTLGSDELLRLYGFDPATQKMPDFKDQRGRCYPVEDWERINAAVGRALETGEEYELDVRVLRAGAMYWVTTRGAPVRDAQGRIVGLRGTVQDITERKRTEEAVRESEARYRQTLESIPGMVFTTRPDGYCDYQSQQWVDFTGVPMSEHLGDGWNKLLHPDDRPRAYAAWRAAVEERAPYDLEYRVRRHDGEYEWFKVIGRPISDSEGRIVRWFGTALNIQDLVVARAAMEESEARYRLLVEQTVDGIFVADGRGQYQDVNSAGAAMLGYTRDEIRHLSLADVLAVDEAARLPGAVAAYAGGGVVRSEWRFRRKDGSLFPGEVMGRQLPDGRLLGILRDITERHEAEKALRESERLYRAIGESIDYGIWICDAQGRNIYASESLLKLVGITKEQCKDFGWGDVLHPEDAQATIAAWKQCVQTGGPWYREHRYRGIDGQWHPILACGLPVRDERGEIIRWAGINLDISRIKQAEERLKSSLREKEVLLKEIHHRVKNNLQVIASLVDLQAEGMREPGLLDSFADIRDRVRSMALIHEKLYQSESLARVDFADYLRSLLGYLSRSQGKAKSGIELKTELEPVGLSVEKAVPCGLIVNELVSNAYKHAFQGRVKGEIRIGLGVDTNGRVWLRVGDNGVGLPAGMDWRRSRSLGLRLIQLLTGQLHASVEVRTECGTEFHISFHLEKSGERD